jgi:phosphocarrier protein
MIMECRGEVRVNWELGLHIRPATNIAKLLQNFSCEVILTKDNISCNAKSVIQLITLAASPGDKITILARGIDAQDAMKSLQDFFERYDDKESEENISFW